jgi:diguanylate cyclase (GGDEF)-like protein
VLVLPGAPKELAAARAMAILEQVRTISVPCDGTYVTGITASLRVAAAPDDGSKLEVLLREADRAMFRAKSLGRDRIECASPFAPVVLGVA